MSFFNQSDKAIETGRVVRCRRCGRELTDPKSQAEGIGPVCKQKEEAEATHTFSASISYRTESPPVSPAVTLRQLDAYIDQPVLFCCQQCGNPAVLKKGLCKGCREKREIEAILVQDREKTIPVIKGVFSEV